jgi:hydrogen peroxide-dependent heme synthase
MTNDAAAPSTADELNELNRSVRYALWAVYARAGGAIGDVDSAVSDHAAWAESVTREGVTLRGQYDVSAMRADADIMLWLHGPTAEGLQVALRAFRRTVAGSTARLVWSAMGTHRPAEFSREHVPAFMQGKEPRRWLCVYPFVRSYEWYLLPEAERGAMLREHGLAGRAFPHVLANTVAAFALNDYEWILPLESDDLHALVDLMRDLRATQARRHVRVEVPFYTGCMLEHAAVIEVLR